LRLYIGFFKKKLDFEGFEGSEGSEVMLGWIVMLMRMNEILLFFVSMDAYILRETMFVAVEIDS
jgi:hypothetical protein